MGIPKITLNHQTYFEMADHDQHNRIKNRLITLSNLIEIISFDLNLP